MEQEMRNNVIAIQGSVASFHDQAAKKYFGNEVTIQECGSFREVCEKLAKNLVDYGIIAIENKVAGSILLNYQLIEQYELNIIGETYLPVELFVLANKGAEFHEIKEIVSHPMALGQSQFFLSGLQDVRVTEYKDTAESAKIVKENTDLHTAVIAGRSVAELYDLDYLTGNVCDEKVNYTRFYILTKGKYNVEHPNKASVNLITGNHVGALNEVLEIVKEYQINLSKIQSIPIPGDDSSYIFHLDLEFENRNVLDNALEALKKKVLSLKVLGIYQAANK
jgi:prephenate dehydratase